MGLFSKDDKVLKISKVPELPKLSSPQMTGLPELPSFPSSSKNENLNQEMVKSAVSDMPSPGEEEMSVDVPENFHISEGQNEGNLIPSKPSENPIPELPSKLIESNNFAQAHKSPNIQQPKSETKDSEPIFIRIDKFQLAQKNFEKIRNKIKEIESVIGKIKNVKSQEEIELKGWSEDIEKIKSRLAEVDADIFNQI